jgi:hypothetical protein
MAGSNQPPSVSGPHHVPRNLPIYVAPTVADESNTVRLQLLAIACWRANHVLFAFDSSFVVPAIRDELARLADLVNANPGCPASIFGHADPTGDDEHNKGLSGRRAIAIQALLTRNVDAWERLYQQSHGKDDWGLRSLQIILAELRAPATGAPYYNGDADGLDGPKTKAAVVTFQRDEALAADGTAGPKTRMVLFTRYMDAICLRPDQPFKMAKDSFLGGGRDPGNKGAVQGCSAFNPVFLLSAAKTRQLEQDGDTDTRDDRNAPNRRVMIFLYRAGTEVSPGDWPCPRATEGAAGCKGQFWPNGDDRRRGGDDDREYQLTRDTMACRFYDRFARLSPCEGVVLPVFRLRLFDFFGAPIPGAVYEVSGEGVSQSGTSATGDIVVRNVPIPSTVHVRWGRPLERRVPRKGFTAADLDPFEFDEEIHLDTKTGTPEENAGRRLKNLGYGTGDLEKAIGAFQFARGADPTGVLPDAERDITRCHDHCEPPVDKALG